MAFRRKARDEARSPAVPMVIAPVIVVVAMWVVAAASSEKRSSGQHDQPVFSLHEVTSLRTRRASETSDNVRRRIESSPAYSGPRGRPIRVGSAESAHASYPVPDTRAMSPLPCPKARRRRASKKTVSEPLLDCLSDLSREV
jgi:hypothetical protein